MSLIIPWGSPPCKWPPYQNGAPEPYLSSNLGTQANLIIEFDNAWWKAQPSAVQELKGLKDPQKTDLIKYLLAQGFLLDAEILGYSPEGPEDDVAPFFALAQAVYDGWIWKPSLATPVNQTPGRPECPIALPGEEVPGKTLYQNVDPSTILFPILDIQGTLTSILESIGVTVIKP